MASCSWVERENDDISMDSNRERIRLQAGLCSGLSDDTIGRRPEPSSTEICDNNDEGNDIECVCFSPPGYHILDLPFKVVLLARRYST